MMKTPNKSKQNDIVYFTKDDITKIEYSLSLGDHTGLFSIAYPVMIRFNNHKVMSFKPCITKTAVIGKGIFKKGSVLKQIQQQLEIFCQDIKATNIPIVRVKKFI